MSHWAKNDAHDTERWNIVKTLDGNNPTFSQGGLLKNGRQSIGKARRRWEEEIPRIATDNRTAIKFPLSPGQAPEGCKPLRRLGKACPSAIVGGYCL